MYFYKTKLQDEEEIIEKFQNMPFNYISLNRNTGVGFNIIGYMVRLTPSIESEYELEYLGYDKWGINE